MNLTTHLHLECVELYLHFPNTSSWNDMYLSKGYIFMVWYLVKHRDNFACLTFTIRGFQYG